MEVREENGVFVMDVQFDDETVDVIILDSGAGCNVWPTDIQVETKEGWRRDGCREWCAQGVSWPEASSFPWCLKEFEFSQAEVSRACCVDHIVRQNEGGGEMGVRAGGGRKRRGGDGGRDRERFQDGEEGPGSRQPSKEERAQHEMTHLPCRSWCRHCVRGCGKQMPHQGGSQETSISEVHMDFAFLGREDDPLKTMVVFVAKERTSKIIMSAVAPRKTTGTYIAERVGEVGFSRRYGREERPGASFGADR